MKSVVLLVLKLVYDLTTSWELIAAIQIHDSEVTWQSLTHASCKDFAKADLKGQSLPREPDL